MSNDRIHLLTLGKPLHEHHKRAVVGRVLVARDAHEGKIIVEGCNFAFEVILSRIDYRDVLARGQAQNLSVLGVIAREPQGENLLRLVGDNLILKEETWQ